MGISKMEQGSVSLKLKPSVDELEIYRHGAEVLVDGNIPARITAVEIRGDLITYQCCWWDERQRRSEWVSAEEVKPKNGDSVRRIRLI